jgi:succinate-acetate transporter protein
MASDDDDADESLMKQVLNMVLENNALMPYLAIWGVFNFIILIVLVYIAIRISIR